MCIGYMQMLQHLYKALEHPWGLVSWGVLEPISHRNGEITTFSMAPDSVPLLPHAPSAAPPWLTLFLLFGCSSHHFICLVGTCSGVGTQLTFSSPGNLRSQVCSGFSENTPTPCHVLSLSMQRGHQIFTVCLFHQTESLSRTACRDPAVTGPCPASAAPRCLMERRQGAKGCMRRRDEQYTT